MTHLITWISTLILAAGLNGGGTPPDGLARYNAYVAQLRAVGCTLAWPPFWGRSYWNCPPDQRWLLTLDEKANRATLRRLR